MPETHRYYQVLGLKPGAALDEIKQAYRDMVKVWHPDRFTNEPRLGRIAEHKLKEINEAYEGLTSRPSGSGNQYAKPKHTEANGNEDEWRGHTLCRDGRCIGTIGRDGRCRVCGKPYESDGQRIVHCSSCGTKNRLDKTENLSKAACGKCHARLVPSESPAPQQAIGSRYTIAAVSVVLLIGFLSLWHVRQEQPNYVSGPGPKGFPPSRPKDRVSPQSLSSQIATIESAPP